MINKMELSINQAIEKIYKSNKYDVFNQKQFDHLRNNERVIVEVIKSGKLCDINNADYDLLRNSKKIRLEFLKIQSGIYPYNKNIKDLIKNLIKEIAEDEREEIKQAITRSNATNKKSKSI